MKPKDSARTVLQQNGGKPLLAHCKVCKQNLQDLYTEHKAVNLVMCGTCCKWLTDMMEHISEWRQRLSDYTDGKHSATIWLRWLFFIRRILRMKPKRTPIPSKTRAWVLSIADHKCEKCGEKTNEIHHENLDPSDHRIGNLKVLCKKCHRKSHTPLQIVKHMLDKALEQTP